jgi:CRISPR-associated protein Csh2
MADKSLCGIVENKQAGDIKIIKSRNEFLFLYDIKNGNPNGDPDENRPRMDDVTKHCYVTDVRLKRYIRDYLIQTEGEDKILVAELNRKTVTLTERVKQRLIKDNINESIQKNIEGRDLLDYILNCFIDLRMFGSPLAFSFPKGEVYKEIKKNWGETGTITGPIQINFGETLHRVEETTFHGHSTFSSGEEKEQGTFTTYYAIPYGLIAFHGIANENSAKITGLTEKDLTKFKIALWKGIRETSSAHTRTKRDQQPRMLLNIVYKDKITINENGISKDIPTEYHIGSLEEKVRIYPKKDVKEEINIRRIGDYDVDFTKLVESVKRSKNKISRIEYCLSPEFRHLYCSDLIINLGREIGVENLIDLDIDRLKQEID